MKYKMILLALLALPTFAFAGEEYRTPGSVISPKFDVVQNQTQVQSQNIPVDASSTVEVNNPRNPVSTAYAAPIYPTATCMGASSGGGQGMHIGLSFGTSWEDKDCKILETARSFEQAGYTKDALAIRCQSKYAAEAPSCKGLKTK